MDVYIISGLGADERAFQKTKLPEGFRMIHVQWLKPEKRESLQDYVQRLSATIDTSRHFALVGLSFGGVVAGEMSKLIHPQITIILSSIKTSKQKPLLFRFVRLTGIYKILPYSLFKTGNAMTYWAFGIRHQNDKALLKQILADTDTRFLKWAIERLLKWENLRPAQNIYHIHGGKDRLIPLRKVKADFTINEGGHLMVLTQSGEVNGIIAKRLSFLQH
jgi:pimeloyl-ACP methyl ester carboxylesterase